MGSFTSVGMLVSSSAVAVLITMVSVALKTESTYERNSNTKSSAYCALKQ
jgi:hypothetical protein